MKLYERLEPYAKIGTALITRRTESVILRWPFPMFCNRRYDACNGSFVTGLHHMHIGVLWGFSGERVVTRWKLGSLAFAIGFAPVYDQCEEEFTI